MAQPTAEQLAIVLKDIITDKKSAMTNVVTAATRNRISLLRDYLTTSIALLGGALTVLTVKPELAKTTSLLYAGALIVLSEVVLNFMSRRSYASQEENQLISIEEDYAAVTTFISSSLTASTDQEKYDYLTQASKYEDKRVPKVSGFYMHSEKYLGLLLLLGGLSIAISLLFNISV